MSDIDFAEIPVLMTEGLDTSADAAPVGEPIGAWEGVLTEEGKPTGDGRTFDLGSLRWEPSSNAGMPLRWAPEDNGGHGGARHVGWIETATREERGDSTAFINARGTYFDAEFGDYLKRAGKVGLSVDVDDETYDVVIPEGGLDVEPEPGGVYPALSEEMIFHDGRIRGVTAVDIPAFITGYIYPVDQAAAGEDDNAVEETPPPAVVAAVEEDGSEPEADSEPSPAPTHAGVLLKADDTDRWLLLQRSMSDEGDPNAGLWEFPGGGIEDDEDPETAARREFSEEVGVAIPESARVLGQVDSADGVYRLHIMAIPSESEVRIDDRDVVNPDDPDEDYSEAVAWWTPDHITPGGYHIRPEVQNTDWAAVEAVLNDEETAMSEFASEAGPELVDLPEGEVAPMEEPETEGLTDSDKEILGSLKSHHEQILTEISEADGVSPAVQEYLEGVVQEVSEANETILKWMEEPEPPSEEDALIASAAPVAPPDEWFEPMDFDGPTPLTITADGRVYGHLATWNSCHRSEKFARRGECVQPPSDPDAPVFHLGQVITASGKALDVGRITVGGGHADLRGNITAALAHYDDASTTVAAVRAHEDAHGIALYGSVVPGATPEQVAAARLHPLSGDWRKERGKYRLIAAHAVVVPGYPVARGLVASVSPGSFVTRGRVEECSECGKESPAPSLGLVASAAFRSALRGDFEAVREEMRARYSADLRALVAATRSGDDDEVEVSGV